MTTNDKTAEQLIAAMDEFLANPKKPASINEYWAQSVSQSVKNSYEKGDFVNVVV